MTCGLNFLILLTYFIAIFAQQLEPSNFEKVGSTLRIKLNDE